MSDAHRHFIINRFSVREHRGFTLIELLVVISIIGLLSAIVLSSLNTARAKGRDAAREADIHNMQIALELYYSSNGKYPVGGGATQPNGAWSTSNDSSWTTLQSALQPYISKLPQDPAQSPAGGWAYSGSYAFSYVALPGCNQQDYMIVWRPEVSTVTSPGMTDCAGTTYNYGIGTVTVGVSANGH
jgi:type II secretion system protein G